MLYEVDLIGADDQQLLKISEEAQLGLSLSEMRRIKKHFLEKKRNPTDIELQSLGQAWSEHCCYKCSTQILKKFVFGIDAPQNILVIKEDAGVVEFDEDHAYVVALESHNHPSAIEPYGGAATGIGGILRDVVCMGAQPVALIDPLFFGPLDSSHVPRGVKHPRYLFSGVVSGIRDYGNRVGIPTVAGMVYFDEGYIGNCVVNVGCIGVVKKKHIIRSRVKKPGDLLVLVGGKTGRDGIHGVTFASAELNESSEELRGAVQLGDPITKEPLIHACLEVSNKGLLEGMKDLGGGGLSCVVGEMALAGGYGAEVELDRVPLKDVDMVPWEIWVSESQERMMLAVDPKNLKEVSKIFEEWDVNSTVIGKAIDEKIQRIFYGGKKIFEMDMEFLTKAPVYNKPFQIKAIERKDPPFEEPDDYGKILLRLLSSPNIASKEWVIRQYDHEVRASTVIKPLQGVLGKNTHGDATVIKPLESSYRGLAITADVNPSYTKIDPFWGSASAIDEVCRNLASVGAIPHSFADCLNFGNPEKPERLGELYSSAKALGYVAKALEIPFVSGNVSLYNEAPYGSIPPTPSILGIGIVSDIRKCITVDMKKEGNPIYLIGETKKEFGGSEYLKLLGISSKTVPVVDPKALKKRMDSLISAIKDGLIASCHDVSEGGIALCMAEMSIGGDIGARIDTGIIGNMRVDHKLFSESNTRWIVEVKHDLAREFEKKFKGALFRIGDVGGNNILIKNDDRTLIDIPVKELRDVWNAPIYDYMG
ncbi:MAG: phosphoribosylformylglycinamidine synthase subunit PurL [Methanocellales archaeon]|nr:phosphoribosylformylglycinamidine synthase subunit PurL [Methanocellales archaeon]